MLIKEESTEGTDSSPTVALNAIEAGNVKIGEKGTPEERNPCKRSGEPTPHVMGKRWGEASFDVEYKGSGTKGTASRLADLFESMGLAETVSAGSSVTHATSSALRKTVTLYVYDIPDTGSCVLRKLTGAIATEGKMAIKAGSIMKMSIKLEGLYNDPADVADPGEPTFDTTTPPIVESAQFTLNSVTSLVLREMSLELGIKKAMRDDVSSAGGVKGFKNMEMNPSGSFSVEAVPVATYDWWSDWKAATSRQASIIIGSDNGNKMTITLPKVIAKDIEDQDFDGMLGKSVPFACYGDASNPSVQLKEE